MSVSESRRSSVGAAIAGALTLQILVSVAFLLLPSSSVQPWWRSFTAFTLVPFYVVIGAVGAVLAVSWRTNHRVTTVGVGACLVTVFLWPLLALDTGPDAVFLLVGTALVIIPVTVVVFPIEYLVRNADRSRWSPGSIEVGALLVGVGHLLLIHQLKTTLEGRPLLPLPIGSGGAPVGQLDPVAAAFVLLLSLGLILVAAVPLLIAIRIRLLVPAALVALVFGYATYATWRLSIETLPPAGPGFGISPTPLTLYAWGSSLLLVVAVAVAGAEYGVRHLTGIAPPRSPFSDE